MKPTFVTLATEAKCKLAENPLWHSERECIYWTDIPAGKIFQLNISSRMHEVIYHGKPVGGFTLQQNGDLLLFRVSDVVQLSSDGGIKPLLTFSDDGMVQFNDVIAAPDGSIFAGTIGESSESGGLYHLDKNGMIRKLFSGSGCSNGMGFSPDLKSFYWTCSTTRRILQFEYDSESGSIGNRRLFHQASPEEGIPDGLTVDAEGCVWSARWGGGKVVRHGRNGEVLSQICFPETNITSLCFGGKNLDQLFVSAAQQESENSEPATALFHARAEVKGLKEFRSCILLD